MHLTMVVVADASFGWSRFRSEPFLRHFLENFENSQKPAQKRLRNGSLRKRLRPKLASATTTIVRCMIMAGFMA